MKNFIEIPKKEDYHDTTFVDVQAASGRDPQFEKELLIYHKGRVNLRSIVDLHAFVVKMEVLDEEKYPEWEKQRKELFEKQKNALRVVPMVDQPDGGRVFSEEVPPPSEPKLTAELTDNPLNADLIAQGEPFGYPAFGPPIPPPTRIKTIKVTAILYFSGVQRFIVDDYKDFCEVYDNYLTKQKLDM